MKLRDLKKNLGPGVTVTRARGGRTVRFGAAGLSYSADPAEFRDAADLAATMRSKLPVRTLMPLTP